MRKNLVLEDLFTEDQIKDTTCELDLMYKIQPLLRYLYAEWKQRQPKKRKRKKLPKSVLKDAQRRFKEYND